MAIYLDGHATTPLAPEAREVMMRAWSQAGNAASPHSAGAMASTAVETARASVARLVGAGSSEIVFTSGATEANNIAILGTARRCGPQARPRIVVSAVEHKAVLEPARSLRREGFEVLEAPVDRQGRVDLQALGELVNERTLLVSVMAANNETGVIQPLAQAVALARRAGALIHCDAAQAVGKIPIDAGELDVDFMSISAHKLYGPMGIGALYVSASAPRPEPIVFGGGQESGLRAGTLPAPLCAGFGEAAKIAAGRLAKDAEYARALSGRFLWALGMAGVAFKVNGDGAERLPGSVALQLPHRDGDEIVDRLGRDVQFSTGSACNSGEIAPSHVLRAMGLSPTEAQSSIRLLFGRYNTLQEADEAAARFAAACALCGRLATGGNHQ